MWSCENLLREAENNGKFNVAIATGFERWKMPLAAGITSALKRNGYDYHPVRNLVPKAESAAGDRFNSGSTYISWSQEEKAEKKSAAADGFVTPNPLFRAYVAVQRHNAELLNGNSSGMMLKVDDVFAHLSIPMDRYGQIIVTPQPFSDLDSMRPLDPETLYREREFNRMLIELVDRIYPTNMICRVEGRLRERIDMAYSRIIRGRAEALPKAQKEARGRSKST